MPEGEEPQGMVPAEPEALRVQSAHQAPLFAQFVNQNTLNLHQGVNMPPFEEARVFEVLYPGFTQEWLNMGKAQMAHRQALEKKFSTADIEAERDTRRNRHEERMTALANEDKRHGRGMAAVVLVVLLFSAAAIVAGLQGKLLAAGLFGAGPVVAIVANIIRSTWPAPKVQRGGRSSELQEQEDSGEHPKP